MNEVECVAMPEPLKLLYNRALLERVGDVVYGLCPSFDRSLFMDHVLDEAWDHRELKDRMGHITAMLARGLPDDYHTAVEIMTEASQSFRGFEYMFFPGFVERYGLADFERSMGALARMTSRASSEFAVRPFIKQYGGRMIDQMLRWADSPDEHIRRLASEGCRPRLPWAMSLPEFKTDPSPILPILERLKQDEHEYVRRSVANCLNDIAKDHPQCVVDIARSWLGDNPQTDWIVKHGCRTLLKQGLPDVLTLFCWHRPDHVKLASLDVAPSVKLGEQLAFTFELKTTAASLGRLRLEYAMDFRRKAGTCSRKVFKISESAVEEACKTVTRRHSFRPITTRTYYPGQHGLAVIVNGVELGHRTFDLTP